MVFNRYAQYYDLFYRQKGYGKECAFLKSLFKKHKASPKTILDLGCGTGKHMVSLLKRGYHVAGLDSSSGMLRVARKKVEPFGSKAGLHKASLPSFDLKRKFDAVICMFSVIDYIVNDSDLEKTLSNVANHLQRGSLFIFDFWNAPCVVQKYSPQKSRVFNWGSLMVERCSRTKILSKKNICEVEYTCRVIDNHKLVDQFKEKHVLRYFTVEEMSKFLLRTGFKVLGLYPFMNIQGKIRSSTWDITMVAQKI